MTTLSGTLEALPAVLAGGAGIGAACPLPSNLGEMVKIEDDGRKAKSAGDDAQIRIIAEQLVDAAFTRAKSEAHERDANARIDTHEAVCSERYAGINARLRRMEGWIVSMVAAVLGLMATIIIKGL